MHFLFDPLVMMFEVCGILSSSDGILRMVAGRCVSFLAVTLLTWMKYHPDSFTTLLFAY